ncbi:hypothetical protein LZ32DRAFT_604148, partial [Colletotrichum eremochloae]
MLVAVLPWVSLSRPRWGYDTQCNEDDEPTAMVASSYLLLAGWWPPKGSIIPIFPVTLSVAMRLRPLRAEGWIVKHRTLFSVSV